MNLGVIQALGADRGPEFYRVMLVYAQHQLARDLPARAILCLDRAMGADIAPDHPLLREHPMPYAALGWILTQHAGAGFLGNPRVHFQHYADRMNAPRRELRRWRAWACWALSCHCRPELPADPRHRVRLPSLDEICGNLSQLASPTEATLWRELVEAEAASDRTKSTGAQKTFQTTLDSNPPLSTVCAPFPTRGGSSAG